MRPANSAAPMRASIATPELLAPAGDRECVRAAVENGADAVYFGLDTGFNARARATNIGLDELDEVMQFLHGRQVKGYVTLNTLIFTSELVELEATVRRLVAAGVDAVLVQDLGAVRLIRAVCPELPIHASTQMTLTSAECLRVAEELGVERVVLPRELSIDEIAQIHRQTSLPLEAFVHGALCVAYSGQCMTSESLGGRSANRGQCAQACRLPYELVCDDRDVDLGAVQYLLSPQDLAAYALVPELLAAGITSLKIEGRLKTPEYVANITRHYRRAIDAALANERAQFTPTDIEQMELSFSRGFSPGWLHGCDHKMLVPGLSSAKRGVPLGSVIATDKSRVVIELCAGVKRGDGVVFDGDRAAHDEQGGRVFEVFVEGRSRADLVTQGIVELAFAHGAVDFGRLRPGQQIWKTDDPQLTQSLRKTFSGEHPQRRLPLEVAVTAAVGQPLQITARAGQICCAVISAEPLVAAERHPLTPEVLTEQLGRLGGTAYVLARLDAHIDGTPMAPLSVLGKLRHALVHALDKACRAHPARQCAPAAVLPDLRSVLHARAREVVATPAEAVLHVLCRSLEQVRRVVDLGERSLLAELQDIRQYGEAVQIAHGSEATILLATPRIQKPEEAGIFQVLMRHGADGMLVRNLAGLRFYAEQGVACVADFSLNATNELSVECLIDQGALRVTASYDLNREQLLDLSAAVPPAWLEVVVHQHMPLFHMEHCVFCAVLSPGTNKTNCGRPCDDHTVRLRDRIGVEHPLEADVGCRNTLYNAVPQSAAEAVPALLQRGLRHFRIELLKDLPTDELAQLITLYRELLAARRTGKEVWSRLKAANRVGVTRGTLEERRNPLAIL